MIVAKRYQSAEIELIEILQLVGEHRVFYHLKYNSLFQYTVQALGLSEEVAYIYINVSRKAAEVPKLKEEIKTRRISVSKARTICSVLKEGNQNHWLELARLKTKRQLEREVALASPKHAVRESAHYVSEPIEEHAKILNLRHEVYVELKLGVPEQLMLKLRQAQDLVSQSKQKHSSLVETLEAMVDLYLQKRDPVVKAKRQKIRGQLNASVKKQVPGTVNVDTASAARKPISACIKNQIYLKHQGQCSHLDTNGNRCPQRRLLQIHHILPVSKAGSNELDNLTLLCQGHHRVQHLSPTDPWTIPT